MKNIILVLMFILPNVGYTQRDGSKIMDVNNIDYRLLDSLIVVEINKVRDSLGNLNMNYSRVVSDNISKRTCNIMFKEQHVYHPDGRLELYSDKVESSILKESLSTYNFTGGVSVVDGYEICLFKMQSNTLITYSDYAKSIVDLWESSRDHCHVVRDAHKKQFTENGKERFLMSGVCTKYGTYGNNNGFYTVLNLSVVYKY